jgi:DNA anti-recombination protein RmuC
VVIPFLDWLRDLIEIYTWKELWIVVSAPTILTGVLLLFAFMFRIEDITIRSAAIWSLLSSLMIAGITADYYRKHHESA